MVLAGPSGSGKSSLLRAGVLPRLRRAGGDWLVVPPFRPQSDPCQQLAQALALAAGRGTDWDDWDKKLQVGESSKDSEELPRVLKEIAGDLRMSANLNEAQILLSIDQGEELFGGLAREEVERFFRIVSVAMGDDVPFLAVMTLRSEFLGRLQAEAKKNSLTARFQVQSLGPMPVERIPEIIEGPAELAGLQVEKDFVNRVKKDAETEDALPLLADALRELYENYHLTLPEYEALGDKTNGLSPLENIVCKRADDVLKKAQPPDEEKEALRDALLKMVRIEEGNYVRQAAGSDKLPPKAKRLLDKLVNARLLISREEEGEILLEVAHEALLRKWELLRDWLKKDQEFLIDRQELEKEYREWNNTPPSKQDQALRTGLKLQRAKAWLADPHTEKQLNEDVRRFVQTSIDQAETQEQKERRIRFRVMAGLSGLTALALAGGGIAWWREGAARAAQAEQYTANHRALLSSNPLESVVNGLAAADTLRSNPVAALQLSDTLEQAVINNLERDSIPTGQGQVFSLVALPNGELASAGMDTIKRWGKDGNQIGRTITSDSVFLLVALPNGELASAGGVVNAYSDTTIKRWGKDGNQIGPPIPTDQSSVSSLVALPNGELASGGSNTIKRWGKDGKQIGPTIFTTWVTSLVALPNGELVSGGNDGNVKRWGKDGKEIGKPIITGQREVSSLVALPHGELASAGPHKNSKGDNTITTIKRWDKDGNQIGRTITTDQVRVTSLVALPNGELASAGSDMNSESKSSIKRWGIDGNQIGRTITTDQVRVTSLVALPNDELVSGGIDGNVKRWGKDGKPVTTIKTGKERITSLVALTNGELAIGGDQGSFTVWGKDGEPPATIKTDKGKVTSLVALPDDELAIGGVKGLMRWRKDGKPIAKSPATQEEVSSLAALPNGELVSGGIYGNVKRWGKDGNQIGKAISTYQGRVTSLVALADGRLASIGDDAAVPGFMLWDKDGTSITTSDQKKRDAYSLLALPNGELLSGGREGLMRWSKDGQPIVKIPTAQGPVLSLAALPNDALVSGGDRGSVKFWDKAGKPMGTITAGKGRVTSLVALPKDELVALLISDDVYTVRRWSLEAVAKRGCFDLRDHPALLKPQTPPQWAAKQSCGRFGVLKGK